MLFEETRSILQIIIFRQKRVLGNVRARCGPEQSCAAASVETWDSLVPASSLSDQTTACWRHTEQPQRPTGLLTPQVSSQDPLRRFVPNFLCEFPALPAFVTSRWCSAVSRAPGSHGPAPSLRGGGDTLDQSQLDVNRWQTGLPSHAASC